MHDDAQWVSIAEAARRLNCSVVTVRRRVKQGTLEGELQQGRRGPEYRVRLPPETPVTSLEPSHDDRHEQDRDDAQELPEPTHEPPPAAELIRLVERQQAELRDLHYELTASAASSAEWRTRAEQLERRLEDLRAELERARRSWWRRWFG
jgi:hypothetical protein